MKAQRLWAVIGLILICASILLMLVGLFAGSAKALLLQISLFCFLGSVGILLALSVKRNKAKQDDSAGQDAE